MIQEPPSKAWIPITVAIIGGTCAVIAAIAGVVASRILDRTLPAPTPAPAQATVHLEPASNVSTKMLVINGANYPYPDSTSTPYCIASELNTGMGNRVSYEITVPDGWVMAWDFYKAYWGSDQHESDGLLVITGPWQGSITIDTGGSCSGPIEWSDWIVNNRMTAFPVPSRPIFYLGQNP